MSSRAKRLVETAQLLSHSLNNPSINNSMINENEVVESYYPTSYETSTYIINNKEENETTAQLIFDKLKETFKESEIPESQVFAEADEKTSISQEEGNNSFSEDNDDSDADKHYIPSENNYSDTDSSSSNDHNTSTDRKSRKRVRKSGNWKRNIKKMHVNRGETYVTESGNIKREKCVQNGCDNKCRLKCCLQVTEEQRKKIFASYYETADITRQRNFVKSCIEKTKPRKYRTCKPESTRSLNYSYFFVINDEKVKVCKKFFKATLDISNTFISTVISKLNRENIIEPDKRGRHGNQKKLNIDLEQGVMDHINSFCRIESHYCRADNKREFIDGGLNVSTMYRMYVEKCKENSQHHVKASMYAHIFNTKFNIGFFRPKKDLCSLCDEYNHSNSKSTLEEKFNLHLNEKDLARKEKSADVTLAKENENTKAVYCFDLQAVMPLPSGDVSTFYYKSKLNVINFTIFDIPKKEGFSYLWHEGIAKRGANEIGTCIYDLLRTKCVGKDVTLYSDNCVGQNKNRFIVSMFLFCMKNYNIKSITHKFLIAGHTQMEGDSMHSCIEQAKTRALKSGPIYVPDQISMIIKLAKKTGKPYLVDHLKTKDVIDWKAVAKQYGTISQNTVGEKVVWNKIKIFHLNKENENSIFYKESYKDSEYKEIQITCKKPFDSDNLPLAYKEEPKITYKKKCSLLSLLPHIPPEYHQFFKNLKSMKKGQLTDETEIDEDDE